MILSYSNTWYLLPVVGTGWRTILVECKLGDFFPAEPVGFWTSAYRYALRIGVNFLVWVQWVSLKYGLRMCTVRFSRAVSSVRTRAQQSQLWVQNSCTVPGLRSNLRPDSEFSWKIGLEAVFESFDRLFFYWLLLTTIVRHPVCIDVLRRVSCGNPRA